MAPHGSAIALIQKGEDVMLEKPKTIESVKTKNGQALKWSIGERVVYPSQGVGEIVAIESNDLFGPGAQVYVLELIQQPRRVTIATEKAEKGALRQVVSPEEANTIIASLKEAPPASKAVPWTKRQRILKDKLASSCLQDVADVVRELYHLKSVKDLSFSQRRLFDTGIGLLVQELSISLKRPASDIEAEIRAMFA